MIDFSSYTAGGYVITKSVQRAAYRPSALLPEHLISLSPCISDTASVSWGWNENAYPDALRFGIPAAKLPEFAQWSTEKFRTDVDFPDIFYNLDAAQRFIAEFLPSKDDLLLIGIGLPTELVDKFLRENKQTVYESNEQVYIESPYGLNYVLNKRQPLLLGGETLGFEIIGHHINLSCSWLCSHLEQEMHREFGIRPNKYGLIDTYDEAFKVYNWILEDEQQGTRAEPIPYYPWLLLRYPLDNP